MPLRCHHLLLLAALLGSTAAMAQWADPRAAPAGSLGTLGPPPAQRPEESVTAGFYREFPPIWSIFVRAMKESPELRKGGTITVSFTIEADGRVTGPRLVASDFSRPDLEEQVMQRIGLLRFDPGNFAPKPISGFRIPLYPAPPAPKPTGPSRSLEEIQMGFDRQSKAFMQLYSDAKLKWPKLSEGGTVNVSYVVEPDGSVTGVTLVSSMLDNPEFEEQLLEFIRSMRYEAKKLPPYKVERYALRFHDESK